MKIFHPAKKQQAARRVGWADLVEIIDLNDEGLGVARRKNKVVFVADALPGELVRVRCDSPGKRFDEAVVEERLRTAPERVDPACPLFERCGGCQLQHLSEEAQRAFKQARLQRIVQSLGGQVQPPLLAQSWGYRHRVRFRFKVTRDDVHIGFSAPRSHRMVVVPDCLVLEDALRHALTSLQNNRQLLRPFQSGEILLATSDLGEVYGTLISEKGTQAAIELLCKAVDSINWLEVRKSGRSFWQAPEVTTPRYPGQSWGFTPADFTQANPAVNAKIIHQVRDWLKPSANDFIVDAFCGLGNFALTLAESGAEILGLEFDQQMVERARENAAQQDLKRVRFMQSDLFTAGVQLPANCNKLLLDPPRAGAQALCTGLAASGVQEVVYVSCNPASFARDAEILQQAGFSLTECRWADMFPQSWHMEALGYFKRLG